MMETAIAFRFQDNCSSDEAYMSVRYDSVQIALCLSLKSDGDLEVVMNKSDGRKLLEGLEKALR